MIFTIVIDLLHVSTLYKINFIVFNTKYIFTRVDKTLVFFRIIFALLIIRIHSL